MCMIEPVMDHRSEADILSSIESISLTNDAADCNAEKTHFEDRFLLQLLEKGFMETAEELNAYRREISSFLTELDLDIRLLPADIRDGLDKVACILRTAGLTEPNEMEMQVLQDRKKIEEKKRQREEAKLTLQHSLLLRKQTTFQRKLNQLQEAVDNLQCFLKDATKEEDDSESNRIVLAKKLAEYYQTAEKLENDLEEMQVKELYPDNILSKYQQFLNLTEEMANLDKFLDQYEGLPPNLLHAKAIVENKMKECEELEQLFKEKTN